MLLKRVWLEIGFSTSLIILWFGPIEVGVGLAPSNPISYRIYKLYFPWHTNRVVILFNLQNFVLSTALCSPSLYILMMYYLDTSNPVPIWYILYLFLVIFITWLCDPYCWTFTKNLVTLLGKTNSRLLFYVEIWEILWDAIFYLGIDHGAVIRLDVGGKSFITKMKFGDRLRFKFARPKKMYLFNVIKVE